MKKIKNCYTIEELKDFSNGTVWNRSILKILMTVTIIHFLIDFACVLFFGPAVLGVFGFKHFFIVPILCSLIGITMFLNHKVKKYNNYIIVVLNILFSFIMAIFHLGVVDFKVGFLASYCTSLIYFDKKIIRFGLIVQLIFYIICLFLSYGAAVPMIMSNLVQISLISVVIYLIFSVIINRVMNVVNNFICSLEEKKDLTAQKILMEQAVKFDALTKLYNHKTFHEYMQSLVDQNEKNDLQLQLAIIDIDHFKKVNDTYGHNVGDIVLNRVAAKIKELASPDDIVSRYGGEEFTIIFTGKTMQQSLEILENIRQEISNLQFREIEWNITVSAGLHNHVKYENKDDSFIKADKALYKAKNNGRNQIIISE